MNELLRKRYNRESAFIKKQITIIKEIGKHTILTDDSGNEWYVVEDNDTGFKVFNPHLNLRSTIRKRKYNRIRKQFNDYILKDKYCYGVEWRLKNNLPVRNLEWCSENCI